MSENIYPKGVTFFPPREGTPEFVMGTLIINPEALNEFIKQRKDLLTPSAYGDQLRLTQIKNQEGKIYFKVDTYKKQEGATQQPTRSSAGIHGSNKDTEPLSDTFMEDVDPYDDLPF
jgi:hypothetical protein